MSEVQYCTQSLCWKMTVTVLRDVLSLKTGRKYDNLRFDNDEKTEATHFRILDPLKLISVRKKCGIVDARFYFMYFKPYKVCGLE
jgi:hypothetical protein